MTSATMKPVPDTGSCREPGRGLGLIAFAAVVLGIVGCFNLTYGIAAVANSHVFAASVARR